MGMFEEMQPHVHEANVITCCATISARSEATQWPFAVGSFEEMQSDGLQADWITYNATISACSEGQQWQLEPLAPDSSGNQSSRRPHHLLLCVVSDFSSVVVLNEKPLSGSAPTVAGTRSSPSGV